MSHCCLTFTAMQFCSAWLKIGQNPHPTPPQTFLRLILVIQYLLSDTCNLILAILYLLSNSYSLILAIKNMAEMLEDMPKNYKININANPLRKLVACQQHLVKTEHPIPSKFLQKQIFHFWHKQRHCSIVVFQAASKPPTQLGWYWYLEFNKLHVPWINFRNKLELSCTKLNRAFALFHSN